MSADLERDDPYEPTTDLFDDPRVLRVAEEYLASLEAGFRPRREEILAQYPDLAETLSECLDGLDMVHGAGPQLPKPMSPIDPFLAEPLGDFRLVREIGRGGMGVVYEAVQLSLGRRVALKVLPFAAAFDEKHLQRFKNEAQAAAQLHHTGIVPVYAVGCERGVHFYAMQIIDGRTLAAVIRELRQLSNRDADPSDIHAVESAGQVARRLAAGRFSSGESPPVSDAARASTATARNAALSTERSSGTVSFWRNAARITIQAAEALDHAHQMGIVHRDVKPANLLLDARGNVWITDFGLAQFHMDAGLTRTGDLVGTLRYMSPEQALGQRAVLDQRTDVYSLGVTLYELLTLEPVFPGYDRQAMLRAILDAEPRLLRAIDRSIPTELETIVLKAIAKSPADRYGTAQEFADDLQRFLDDVPIKARRPTAAEKAVKWGRRHRAVVATTAVLFFVGAIGLGVAAALIAREHSQTLIALDGETRRAGEASEQRIRAEARFAQARRAVEFLTQVGEEEMNANPQLLEVRRRLLETALSYYQEFIDQGSDDKGVQAELAAAQRRVTRILGELSALKGSGETLSLGMLLDSSNVRENLQMTPAQQGKTKAILDRLVAQCQAFLQLGVEEKSERIQAFASEQERTLAELVTPQQAERLQQIKLQFRGPRAFGDPDIANLLRLTKQQRVRLRGLLDEDGIARLAFRQQPGKEHRRPPDGRESLSERILAELTPEQAAAWKQMTGEPFKGKYRPDMFMSRGPRGTPP